MHILWKFHVNLINYQYIEVIKNCIKNTISFIQSFNIWWVLTRFQVQYDAGYWWFSGRCKPLLLYTLPGHLSGVVLYRYGGNTTVFEIGKLGEPPASGAYPKSYTMLIFCVWQIQKSVPLRDCLVLSTGLPLSSFQSHGPQWFLD